MEELSNRISDLSTHLYLKKDQKGLELLSNLLRVMLSEEREREKELIRFKELFLGEPNDYVGTGN